MLIQLCLGRLRVLSMFRFIPVRSLIYFPTTSRGPSQRSPEILINVFVAQISSGEFLAATFRFSCRTNVSLSVSFLFQRPVRTRANFCIFRQRLGGEKPPGHFNGTPGDFTMGGARALIDFAHRIHSHTRARRQRRRPIPIVVELREVLRSRLHRIRIETAKC